MAIKGSLREASLPDVLQLLALGQKTGCLSVADRANFGSIYFEAGRITYASIVNRPDRLGDILVKHGRLRPEHLAAAIEAQSRDRYKRLGQILVDQGWVTRADLEHFVRFQIEEAVYLLFTWTQGTFKFDAGVRPEREELQVSINPESLLLEGARRTDEWSLIEKKIPSFDLIFVRDAEHVASDEVEITPDQDRVLALLDGTRDVVRVVEDSGLSEFDVGKALYGLLSAGFVRRAGRSQAVPRAAVSEGRVQEHRNLGIAFYKTGMYDEAGREFRRVVDLKAGDAEALAWLGLVALRQARWQEAVDALGPVVERGAASAAVLHNLGLACEQLGDFDRAEAVLGDAATRARHDARVMTSWGVVALRRGDHAGAAGRLDRAREIAGDAVLPPVWHWARSLAAAGQGELEEAETLLAVGDAAHPGHPVLVTNRAAFLELLGEPDRAAAVLDDLLADEPAVPQAWKNRGDLHYRAGQYDEAGAAYRRAIRLQADLGDDVHFKLGNIAYRAGDRTAAGEHWRQTLTLNPGHELARTNLEALGAPA
jgi:tetratricopeptide (TPR) repeat protein